MDKVISKDGTAIAYEKTGQGPALILVGGALNDHNAPAAGTSLAELLRENFSVYSYDRRGRGESSDTAPYEIERETEDIAALIKQSGGSAYVYGMSSGGALALAAAAHGVAITKLAMYEPPFVGGNQGDAYSTELKELIRSGRMGDAVKLFMKTVGVPGPAILAMQLMPMWKGLKKLAPTLVYDAIIMGDGTVPSAHQLAKVTIPTAVLTGSTPQMSKAGRTLAHALPNAHHRILEGQSHNVDTAVLASALGAFFA